MVFSSSLHLYIYAFELEIYVNLILVFIFMSMKTHALWMTKTIMSFGMSLPLLLLLCLTNTLFAFISFYFEIILIICCYYNLNNRIMDRKWDALFWFSIIRVSEVKTFVEMLFVHTRKQITANNNGNSNKQGRVDTSEKSICETMPLEHLLKCSEQNFSIDGIIWGNTSGHVGWCALVEINFIHPLQRILIIIRCANQRPPNIVNHCICFYMS